MFSEIFIYRVVKNWEIVLRKKIAEIIQVLANYTSKFAGKNAFQDTCEMM